MDILNPAHLKSRKYDKTDKNRFMTKALCCCSDVNGIIGGGLPKDIQIVMLSNGGHGGREWDNQRVHQVESRKANMT